MIFLLDTIANLLLHKQLRFDDGKIVLLDQRVAMLPLYNVVELQKQLERLNLQNSLYFANKKFGKDWTGKIYASYKMNENQIFQWGINSVTLAGWGSVKLVDRDVGKKIFKFNLVDSGMAYYYGPSKKPIDHIFRGMIAGAMSAIYSTDLDAVETKCKAQGHPVCEFIVQPKSFFGQDVSSLEQIAPVPVDV